MSSCSPFARRLCLALIPVALVVTFIIGLGPSPLGASSHREAPLIASDPDADATDFYMFVSPDAQDSVTLIANYIPFSAPEGAPNFNAFSPNVLYEINLDTVGDGKAHVKYQFQFSPLQRNNGGGSFLYNTGPVTSLSDPDLHGRPGPLPAARARRPAVSADDALAWAQLKAGDLAGAVASSRAALRLGTRDPAMRLRAGIIAAAAGDSAAAREHLRIALEGAPSLTPLQAAAAREALAGLQ